MTKQRCVLPRAHALACRKRWAVPAHILLLTYSCIWYYYAVPQGCCLSTHFILKLPSVIVGKHVPFAAVAGRGARRVRMKPKLRCWH